MDMGQPSNERAQLDALISAAAPDPAPAGQVLPLLQRSGEQDAAVLGRLAYHALTGVDPGDGEPLPPGEVAPGFPPFAAEVLMRAICGPDHRRPTVQALLIVLDTVPLASWPGADRPSLTLDEPAADVAPENVGAQAAEPQVVETQVVEPQVVETQVVEAQVVEAQVVEPQVVEARPEREPEPEPEVEVDEEVEERAAEPAVAAIHHDEFRSLLTPSRSVPRFDPLTDPLTGPWDPDTGEIAPIDLALVTGAPATEPATEPAPEVTAEPAVVEQPAPVAESTAEFVAELDGEPVAESVTEPDDEPIAEPEESAAAPDAAVEEAIEEAVEEAVEEPVEVSASEDSGESRGMHDEFRDFVSPSFAVPRFEPLEGTLPAGSDRVRRRRTRQSSRDTEPPRSAKAPKEQTPPKERTERTQVAHASSDDDRRQTLLLVGVILVLVVLGAVWAMQNSGDDEPDGPATPQGASRVTSQPFDASA